MIAMSQEVALEVAESLTARHWLRCVSQSKASGTRHQARRYIWRFARASLGLRRVRLQL